MTGSTLPEAADTQRLTNALRTAGVLGDGRVREVNVESNKNTILSQILRLRLVYDGVAEGAPPTLILKTCHPDRVETFWFAGRSEVAFYRDIAPQMAPGTIPRCFEANYDEGTKVWHLLLEDLTDTHMIATTWPLPPQAAQCETIVASLARAHASWWNDHRLGKEFGGIPDAGFFDRFTERFAKFRDRHGDRLSQDRCDLYLKLLAAAPRLCKRFELRHLTITHGDAHAGNFLLPRDGTTETVRVFDWDSWRNGIGSDDLAYMIAMHWYPERRARLEGGVLDRYHEMLLASGVDGYSRDALDDDYRLSTLFHILTPVQQWWNNIPPVIWWNNLERVMMAVDDLDCRALLD
jgi:hypothetical protein